MSRIRNKNPQHKHLHIKLDVDMLDAETLKDEVLFESAISVLEGHLVNPAVDKEKLIQDILAMPNLFELFVSGMTNEGYSQLCACMSELFPSNAGDFGQSMASVLLRELSRYCGALQDTDLGLDDCLRAIDLAQPVLSALAVLCSLEDPSEDMTDDKSQKAKRATQRIIKKARRSEQRSSVDDVPFVRIGVPVPSTQDQAIALTHNILKDQKDVLIYYLSVLRKPQLSLYAKLAYMPAKTAPSTKLQPTEEPLLETFAVIEDVQEPVSFEATDEPLTAALYFDSPEGFGDWRLIIPQGANKDLRKAHKKSPKLFEIILKKLKELSHGLFSSDNQKRLVGMDNDIPIYEAKMTGDTRLVYRVDCEQEYGSDVITQVLRVYGVYTHAQMKGSRFWDAVSLVGARGGPEYRRRCLFRSTPRRPGDYAVPPAMWPPQEEEEQATDVALPDVGLSTEEQRELHNLIVSEKFVPFSQAFLNGIVTDHDVTHPFYMSPQEQSIVLHRGTSYVQGRSGTGKTTTMVFKMIGVERRWVLQQQDPVASTQRPRQLFVTQSRVLAEKVEEYFVKMSRALEVEYQENVHHRPRGGSTVDSELVDRDEEERHESSLPTRWSELTDKHFPLFITCDQLCRLLEADFSHRAEEVTEFWKSRGVVGPSLEFIPTQHRGRYVSYANFQVSYWKRLPQHLTRGLNPSSIYAEFIGVIKGSEQALSSRSGVMERDAYSSLSHRATTFTEQQRDVIYGLFEAYMKLKHTDESYDAADRTHDIIHNLRKFGIPGSRRPGDNVNDLCYCPGKKVDYVYIDETQDNLLVDTFIFRFICRRSDGLFWAGDTAQTISAGSTFKFNELKSFMYRLEKGSGAANAHTFQLTKNYRSHGGIVKCAHTVVRIISRFWPQTIDNLQAEQGIIDGVKPTFFNGGRHDTPHFKQFLSGDIGTTIEFGAKQCIIVRDDNAREQLIKEFGSVGLIFTVLESKGLEFEDVVIYNFFADSTASLSQWRIVLHELASSAASEYLPTFDEIKHHVICRESKSLYVALTRARLNVWVIDYSGKGEPMKLLWQSQNQISTWTPGMPVPRLTTASSHEEWKTVGRELFESKKFMQAVYAFERAGLPRQRDVAQAYHLRELARQLEAKSDVARSEQLNAYRVAAKAFSTAGEAATKTKEARVYFRISAQCYADAGDNELAGKYYEQAQEYTLSAQTYRVAGCFDDAVRLTKAHKDEIKASVVENIVDVSRLHYLRSGALSKAEELFQTSNAALEFTQDYGLSTARASLLELAGRYEEAADMHLQDGKVDEAVRVFLLSDKITGPRQACQCILTELRKIMSLGIRLPHDNAAVRRLFFLVSSLPKANLQPQQRQELAAFDAIASNDISKLKMLIHDLSGDESISSAMLAFLCADHVFSLPFTDLGSMPHAEFLDALRAFSIYTRRLRQLAFLHEPCDDPNLQQLLAFQLLDNDQCVVYPGTLLADYMNLDLPPTESDSPQIEVPVQQLKLTIRSMLRARLVGRVHEENQACRELDVLREPCSYFVADGSCRDGDSCAWLHTRSSDLSEAYEYRMALILAQIDIYETVSRLEWWVERREQQRFWLAVLYGTWNSPFVGLLKTPLSGHFAEWAVKKWLTELLFDHALDPRNNLVPPGYMSSLLRYFTLFQAVTRRSVPPFLKKLPCSTGPHPAWVSSERVHVLEGFLSFKTRMPLGLRRCVKLVSYVFEARIPVDPALLCDLLDDMSTAFIIALRVRTVAGRLLHGIILPRRWLLRATDRMLDLDSKGESVGQFEEYLAVIKTLLQHLYDPELGMTGTNDDHSHPLLRLAWPRRNIMIARLCHNLALVGFNIQNQDVKKHVHLALKSFCSPEAVPRLHLLYQGLVAARLWLQIEDIVQRNALKMYADDMVQLVHKNRSATMPQPNAGIMRIVYQSTQDIPGILLFSPPVIQSPGAARAVAVAAHRLPHRSHAENRFSVLTMDVERTGQEDDGDALPNDSVHNDLDSSRDDNVSAPVISTEDIQKLQKICDLWSRKVQRREREVVNPMSKVATSRSRYFKLLLDKIRIPNTHNNKYYRMLYLGCVPHVLSCLEIASAYVREGKRATTKRLLDDKLEHMELDAVQSEFASFNTLSQKIVNFGNLLKPSAEVHRQADHDMLRRIIYDTQDLVDTLPQGTIRECQEDMRLAMLGIRPVGFEERKVPPTSRQASRPQLQVEDEFDYSYAES